MTHQYTKLADALESYTGDGHGYQVDDAVLREAASILRAAAAVDVAGLMDAADRYALSQTDPKHWRAALESALRMALAGREGFVLVPVEPTPEMVDAARSLTSWPDGIYRAMIAAAPKGTP